MKKMIVYSEDDIKQIVALLNGLTVSGIQNYKQLAVVAQILDSGMPGETKDDDPEQIKKEGEV